MWCCGCEWERRRQSAWELLQIWGYLAHVMLQYTAQRANAATFPEQQSCAALSGLIACRRQEQRWCQARQLATARLLGRLAQDPIPALQLIDAQLVGVRSEERRVG